MVTETVLRFGSLAVAPDATVRHTHRPVTSPNYVLHARLDEWRRDRTLCGSRIDRRWMRGEVLVKSVCSTCVVMQASRYV